MIKLWRRRKIKKEGRENNKIVKECIKKLRRET